MTTVQTHIKTETPDFQNGDRVVVLGARVGNIGGAISKRLLRAGWVTHEDDCYRPNPGHSDPMDEVFFHPEYQPPATNTLRDFDACVITLGATHMEPFSEVSRLNFRKVIYGSLELPLECARRYVRARLALQREVGLDVAEEASIGKIVFVGSYAHDHPFTHCTSYCVAKAGLDMAVRSLAWELMPEGFDVHIIHPHHVEGTPMTEEVLKGMQEGVHRMTRQQARDYQRKDLRMPQLLSPAEIADMVHWLLENPEARWLSGTSLKMYGGMR